jgi:hypothetical protein
MAAGMLSITMVQIQPSVQIRRVIFTAYLHAYELKFCELSKIGFMKLSFGTFQKGIYFPDNRDAGFFSHFSTSLVDLCQIKAPVQQIKSQEAFRDFIELSVEDAWSIFLNQPTGRRVRSTVRRSKLRELLHHSIYRDLPFSGFEPFLVEYFSPSERVLDRQKFFIEKYSIDPLKTIAVNLRGTDKSIEVPTPPLRSYLNLSGEELARNPGFRILAMSDQRQYLDAFVAEFGSDVIIFEELPSTTSNIVLHKQLSGADKAKFGINLLASVLILASARTLITHTGNVAFWTALYRGNADGLIQLRGSEIFG